MFWREVDARLTVLNEYVGDVPENKRHWSSWLCICFLDVVPRITITVNTACAIAINMNPLSSNNEPSVVVLESYWV